MRQISIPGRYNAKVELAEIRQSEATGAYYLYMEFATDDGECASKRLYLSEKALEYSVKSLNEAFDFDGGFFVGWHAARRGGMPHNGRRIRN